MKRMRLFYETWHPVFQNRPPPAGDFPQSDMYCFLQTGFTHHCEIIEKTNSLDERIFYIQKCAAEFWSKEKLRYNLKSDLFHQQGASIVQRRIFA
ncbi:MAG: DUF1016 N-terminal domain-containing protein [Tannerellaceae bacterium]|nr:DUF1016 N-terminal domain-containing protein [Tannerellaceae bacterium]